MKILTSFFLLLGLVSSVVAQQKITYKPEWKSLEKHPEVPEWIRDAKFGIYTHWGVYAVPAYNNEHYIQHMHNEAEYGKLGTHKRHVALYGPLSEFGYHDFIPQFKGENFNADEWADLFVKGGARFAGPVAEHHDGFAMWDSEVTPFNAKAYGTEAGCGRRTGKGHPEKRNEVFYFAAPRTELYQRESKARLGSR